MIRILFHALRRFRVLLANVRVASSNLVSCSIVNAAPPSDFAWRGCCILYKKLRTTNAIENLNSGIVTYSRNVKRWHGGSMVVRWVSAAIVEAEKKFRRVKG